MKKKFNITGLCVPHKHYMVDLSERLVKIREMVAEGDYFTINRARQYGKTTTLAALAKSLADAYMVVSLDFQALGGYTFGDENIFATTFASYILSKLRQEVQTIPADMQQELYSLEQAAVQNKHTFSLFHLFMHLSSICKAAPKPVVLIIDEVDSAANNQVFLDFLAQLRSYYLERDSIGTATFQSVILASLYDVKNLKKKLHANEEHQENSPWNIAVEFPISMSFSAADIAGMLSDYEADCHTGMDITKISALLYDYTSGYPFLVSKLCKLMDEHIAESQGFPDKSAAWTAEGFQEAVKRLLAEQNTLFESLLHKLEEYPALREILYIVLFQGTGIAYNPDDNLIRMETSMLSFNFNKNKQIGIQRLTLGDKVLIEAVV
ncbi:MAG: 9-O-acetyl-N-acetylneuraminate esterase [Lachnospiraceae bacterium]|nr:9-O-acetyl-N-acetylneuraminate esterase [Lachnospiraceae bacterium]